MTTNTAITTETNLKWKLWKVDNSNLYLVVDKPTTQKLTLSGALGYNNGVTLLDEICRTCYYSDNFVGVTVRNLKSSDYGGFLAYGLPSPGSTCAYKCEREMPYVWVNYDGPRGTSSAFEIKWEKTLETTAVRVKYYREKLYNFPNT